MEYVTVIGSIAGTLTTISFLPQVIKTWRTKSAKDLSLIMLLVLATGVFMWFVYGICNNDMPVIIANLVTFILASMIISMKFKYG